MRKTAKGRKDKSENKAKAEWEREEERQDMTVTRKVPGDIVS